MDKDVGALACAGVLAPFFIISVDRKDGFVRNPGCPRGDVGKAGNDFWEGSIMSQYTQGGLYRPEFEHDNCGIGAVVHIKGEKTTGLWRMC